MLKLTKLVGAALGTIISILLAIYVFNTLFIETEEPISSAPANTHFIDIGNEKIAYSEIDNTSSTTVIFVGGLSAWNGSWERVIQSQNNLTNQYNYIAIDLPPFGYSIPSTENSYFRDIQARRIKEFIEAKGIEKVILVGHSYGAGPVTEYVLNNQDRVEKLVLISAVLNIDSPKTISNFGPVQFDVLRNLLLGILIHNDSFALSQFKKFVYVTDNMNQELLDTYTRYFNTDQTSFRLSTWLQDYVNDPLNYKSNYSENYTQLSIPVRLIWGDKDTVTPLSEAEKLLNILPNVQLSTLNNIGHIPMVEDYNLFDTTLSQSLQN